MPSTLSFTYMHITTNFYVLNGMVYSRTGILILFCQNTDFACSRLFCAIKTFLNFFSVFRASFAAGIAAVRRERRRKNNEMSTKEELYELEEINIKLLGNIRFKR